MIDIYTDIHGYCILGQRFGDEDQIEVLSLIGEEYRYLFGRKYKVRCHKCEADHELFPDATFEASQGDLYRGYLPCGCSLTFKYSKLQTEVLIKRACEKTSYSFLGFAEEWVNKSTRVLLKCDIDGHVWDSTTVGGVLRGSSCPKCHPTSGEKGGFDPSKPSYVYVLKVVGANSFTGFGITSFLEDRMKAHQRNISRANSSVLASQVFSMDGHHARDIENKIKLRFPRLDIQIEGFKLENTNAENFTEVVNFVKSYTDSSPTLH